MATHAAKVAEEPSIVNTQRAKALRQRKGETQLEAANAAGLKYQTYVAFEQGRYVPKADTLRAIAKHLGTTMEDLLR